MVERKSNLIASSPRLFSVMALLVLFCLTSLCYADPPVVSSVKNATIPQSLLDAISKVEQDRIDIAAADAQITIAQAALNAAAAKKSAATTAMADDQAAFLRLWAELYGPTPIPTPDPPTPPVPPVPPVPPTPPTPPPAPCKLRVVVLYAESATVTQRQSLASTLPGSLRAWLTANCLTNAEGTPEWRFWTVGLPCEEPRYQALVDAGQGKPSIVVQAGESGPIKRIDLPADAASAIPALDAIANPKAFRKLPKLVVITDQNYREHLTAPNKSTGYIKSNKPSGLPTLRDAGFPLIPRSQWKQLAKDGKGTFLGDLLRESRIPSKDQDGTNYCWAYASVGCVEAIRALQGQAYIDLSAESVGGPVRGWRNQGGYGLEALEQLQDVGACRASFMDAPNSLSPRRWKSGWEDDCVNHKIKAAWVDIDDGGFDAVVSAAFYRLPVSIGLDWWGHQVMITGVVLDGNDIVVEFRNSWGSEYGDDGFGTLTEGRSQPSGSFACVSVGTSDRDTVASQRGTVVDLVRQRQKSVAARIKDAKSLQPISQAL